MKNIPVFLSQGGTATLVLQEIPHRGIAYIFVRTVLPGALQMLLEECSSFCRSCGAQTCFASFEEHVLSLPHAYDICQFSVEKAQLPALSDPIQLLPLSQENDSIYQRIYNLCFASVSHALTYDRAQIERIYRSGQTAFLAMTDNCVPCGIGELHGNELAAVGVLSEYHGYGQELTLSLLAHCPGPEITLSVVSDNTRAIRLYRRLGFRNSGVISSWYLLD